MGYSRYNVTMNTTLFFQIMILASAVLSVLLIILQQRGASLGSGSGGTSELYTTRRGLEKSLFNATICLIVIFIASILGLLLIPS